MIESGYTKLFSSIVTSTIWREDDKTRIVWITLLAIKNRHGQVAGSVPGLAALANVSIEDCREALTKLSSPDPDSRTKDFEGRRIEVIEGGWQVLNHGKYREAMSTDERRAYQAQWQKKYRQRKKAAKTSTSLTNSVDSSTSTFTHTDTDTDADADAVPLNGDFEVWLKSLDAMWPTQLEGVRKDLQTKVRTSRSPEAKAEWKRRLAIIEERRLGPPVPDAPVSNITNPEPSAPATNPELAQKLLDELKATVAAVTPVRPNAKVMKQIRINRPDVPPVS